MERPLHVVALVAVLLTVPLIGPVAAAGASTGGPDAGASTNAAISVEPTTSPLATNATNTTNATKNAGPPEGPNGYTVPGLQTAGTEVSARDSIRKFGEDGQLWVRYRDRILSGVLTDMKNLPNGATVGGDQVKLGGFLGWDTSELPDRVTVKVVSYQVREVNGSEVPTNVRESEKEIPLPPGYLGPDDRGVAVPIPVEHGENRHVAMWVEGHREQTQWVFKSSPSVAGATVGATTLAGRAGWGILHIGLPFLATASVVLAVGFFLVRKIGIFPRTGFIGIMVGGSMVVFWIPFLWYQSIIEAFAQRPMLIGVLGGLFVGSLGLRLFDAGLDDALFIQPRVREGAVGEDAKGEKWWWPNRSMKVTDRESDGKTIAPRTGWYGALARLWPGYDAAPAFEFGSRAFIVEDEGDEEAAADGGTTNDIRTRISGGKSEDEFDRIYLVDPFAEDVVKREFEGFSISTPTLLSWPDEGEGRRIRGVPIPHFHLGKVVVGLSVVGIAGAFVSWLTTTTLWGVVAALGVLMLYFVQPDEGTAEARLASLHGGDVLANVFETAEEFSDVADADYWRDRYLKTDAERRVERADELDDRDLTMVREAARRLAPEADDAGSREDAPASGERGGGQ